MRPFLRRALRKADKMSKVQLKGLLTSMAEELTRLETAFDSINNGLIVCNTRNRLILKNRAAERYLRLSDTAAEQYPVWDIIDDEIIADFLRTTLRNRDRVEAHEFLVERNNDERRLSLSVLPLVEEFRVKGSLVIVDDVTERRARETIMRRVETLASLTTLAAGVAHEIKNPLASISIHIQLAQKALKRGQDACTMIHKNLPELSDPVLSYGLLDKYLKIVTDEIDRLNRIVVDFLQTVHPLPQDLTLGDITGLLTELLDFVRFELDAANIRCETRFDDSVPFMYDERSMKHAFLNLFKNAKEAMPDGGQLTVAVERAGNRVKISVEDTGCGIPEGQLEKIFEPYWTTKETGSGLGLLLVFKIVREHGGEITVHSHEGLGTRFDLFFPVPPPIHPPLLAFRGGPR